MAITRLDNPLDRFNTYSVHYVLLACRTTEDAKVFVDPGKNSETLAAIESVTRLGDPVPIGTGNAAFLVIDTRRFAQFTIDRLKYETLINGWQRGQSHANLATTIEMTVIDSIGISFINFMQWLLAEKMQCNFDGMVFMLRVLFVGHTASGRTETVQTITLPMHLIKMELNLDHSRGIYTMELMPNMNFDAKSNSRWLQIGTATKYFSGPSNTLGGLIDNFEAELNKRSKDFFNKARAEFAKAGQARQTDNPGGYGRLVKYQITIPAEWNEMKISGWGAGGANETQFIRQVNERLNPTQVQQGATLGQQTDTTVSVDAGLLITDVLDIIFKQVPEISELGTGKRDENSVTFYKHIVGITSDENSFVVHIDVVPFKVPNAQPNSGQAVTQDETLFYKKLENGLRIPKDFIEFDYIYTGKNSDVLNFDMQLQDLTFLLATNLEVGGGAIQRQLEEGQTPDGKRVNTSAELVRAKAYDPLLMPKNAAAELSNFSQYSSLALHTDAGRKLIEDRQRYTQNLSAFYAASPITAVMTIRGNPRIMAKFAVEDFLPHQPTSSTDGAINSENKKKYREDFERLILKDNTANVAGNTVETLRKEGSVFVVNSLSDSSYATSPVFVKVNIKGPNVDFRTNELIKGEEFSREVLLNNYYVVFKVSNLIEGGVFTQELELWSHNVFGHGKLERPENKAATA